MPLFTFADRLAKERNAHHVPLADGRFYRLRAGPASQSAAGALRSADLSQRLQSFVDAEGNLNADAECVCLLLEMAALSLAEVPPPGALEGLPPAALMDIIALATEDDEPPRQGKGSDDLGFAVMHAASAYGCSPWEVWNDWPLWFLNAALEAIPRLEAMESAQAAEWTAMGSGVLKKQAAQQVQHRWRREARGQYGGSNPNSAPAQLAMLFAMARAQAQD